jgi:hypothetical protein
VTNSVWYSGPAVPGGVVTVTVAAGNKLVRVEVTDRCGDGVPVLPSAAPADGEAEGSRGCGWWTRCRRGGGYQGAVASRRPGSSSPWAEPGRSWRGPAVDLRCTWR